MAAILDLPTEETLRYLDGALPLKKARLLEVGCGRGELARALLDRGFAVVALDKSAEMVAAARGNGVPAVEGDFLLYRDSPFDAVLFSRSLHHLYPLEEALDRARSLLRPGGRLVLEEPAVDRMDRPTARWLYDTSSLLQAAGLLLPREWDSPNTAEPLERWKLEHDFDPPIHAGSAMIEAVRQRFDLLDAQQIPHLYRHIHDRLGAGSRADAVVRQVLASEQRLVADRTLRATGIRVTAQVR